MSEVNGSAPVADTSTGESVNNETSQVTETQENVTKPTPSQKKKFLLKVDGEEFEEEFDLSDEEGLRRELQMSRAAKKRMAEANEAKRKAYELMKKFDENPEELLSRLGEKGHEIAEKLILKKIQDQMLTPEQKEMMALKAENEGFKKEKETAKQASERQAAEKMEFDYAQKFQATIIDAVNKSGLPKSPEMVKRMAGLLKKNLEYGLELTPEDLVAEVKKDIVTMIKSIVGDSDGDHLINLFGNDVANKIRKADIKKLQEKQSQFTGFGKKPDQETVEMPKGERRPMTIDEWKEEVNRRIKDN